DSCNWIEIVPDIEAYGADRSGIAQAQANRVGVVVHEIGNTDRVVHVAAVIEDDPAESFHDLQRKAKLRVQNEELATADRYRDVCAVSPSLAGEHATKRDQALRTSFVDGKSAQGIAAA